MSHWERLVNWFERLARPEREPPPAPASPEYERPYVRRTAPEEDARAEQAVRILEAYVRAQSRRRDEPRR